MLKLGILIVRAVSLVVEITKVTVHSNSEGCELRAVVDRPYGQYDVFYRFPPDLASSLKPSADPFLAAFLIPAMRSNERLEVNAPASKKLVEALPKIMSMYNKFSKKYRIIPIRVESTHPAESSPGTESNNALFFSLGMDSFHSLVTLNEKSPSLLSHLIFVRGFEINMMNRRYERELFERSYPALIDVAKGTGKKLLVATTNLRQIGDQQAQWAMYDGGALASVALSLGGFFRKVYMSSDLEPNDMIPLHGVHPDLDPLWSTEATTFIHYGIETRIQKARTIATSELARKHLQVCFLNKGGAYNCCKCSRCVTGVMLPLHLAGALSEFTTFPVPLTPKLVRKMSPRLGSRFQIAVQSTDRRIKEKRR